MEFPFTFPYSNFVFLSQLALLPHELTRSLFTDMNPNINSFVDFDQLQIQIEEAHIALILIATKSPRRPKP
jgi:hypothetical protein